MKRNDKLTILTGGRLPAIMILLILSAFLVLTGCGSSDDDADAAANIDSDNDISLMDGEEPTVPEEEKAAREKEAAIKNADPETFYGTWTSTTSDAENLYGSLKFTINENGTFKADVTDEHFTGKWKMSDQGISYTSELMNGNIYFAEQGYMVLVEDTEDVNDPIRVVLTKVDK